MANIFTRTAKLSFRVIALSLLALIFSYPVFHFLMAPVYPDLFFLWLGMAFVTNFAWFSSSGSWKKSVMFLIVMLIPAFISLEYASQINTADEQNTIIPELVNWSNGNAGNNWAMGALRTSHMTSEPLRLFIAHTNFSDIKVWQIFKGYHWFWGFILAFLTAFAARRLINTTKNPMVFDAVFASIFILTPVSLIALKVLNYDMFSMMLSMLSLVLVLYSLHNKSIGIAILAMTIGYLGAQEKLSAGPFFIFSLVALACVWTEKSRSLLKLPLNVVKSIAIPLAYSIFVLGFIKLTRVAPLEMPTVFNGVFDPLISWTWIPFSFILSIPPVDFAKYLWLSFLMLILACFAATLILYLGRAFIEARKEKGIDKIINLIPLFNVFSIIIVFAAGIYGMTHVIAYWHPFHPIADGFFRPPGEFNGAILHFDSHSYAEHLTRAMLFHCSVFVNAIPTVCVVLAFFGSLWLFFRKDIGSDIKLYSSIIGISCYVPFAWGLCNLPFGNRYLNFAILAVGIFSIIIIWKLFENYPNMLRITLSFFIGAALINEISSFRPTYFPFRPVWAYSMNYKDITPEPGRLNSTWLGWGEENMIVANQLRTLVLLKEIQKPAVFYSAYYTPWLFEQDDVQVKPIVKNTSGKVLIDPAAYYLINRSTFVQNTCKFPKIKPVAILSFRGYGQAFLYKGSDILSDSNFVELLNCFVF